MLHVYDHVITSVMLHVYDHKMKVNISFTINILRRIISHALDKKYILVFFFLVAIETFMSFELKEMFFINILYNTWLFSIVIYLYFTEQFGI